MTAFYQIGKNQSRNRSNIKDGHDPKRRAKPLDWEGAGFTQGDHFNSHNYRSSAFLVYTVRPGQVGRGTGLVVRIGRDSVKLFPYGTKPETIRDWIENDAKPISLDWTSIEAEMLDEDIMVKI